MCQLHSLNRTVLKGIVVDVVGGKTAMSGMLVHRYEEEQELLRLRNGWSETERV